jgi:probable F420-dependent oxidoreductase
MKYGLDVINAWSRGNGVENASRFILDLGVAAEEAGWDGFFLWDHIVFPWPVDLVDPWTALAAIGGRTGRIRLGTFVTPLPRRRPQVLARQLVTIDQITGGRAVLGVGLGGQDIDYTSFGEEFDSGLLADKTDEALQVMTGLWSGEKFSFEGRHYKVRDALILPKPVQRPRIPIWVGGTSKGAIRRASRYDGWVMAGPRPSAGEFDDGGLSLTQVSEALREIRERRGERTFDVVYSLDFPERRPQMEALAEKAEDAGVTWMCESVFGMRYSGEEALRRAREGPPG